MVFTCQTVKPYGPDQPQNISDDVATSTTTPEAGP